MKKFLGFSLVELMISLIVISIVTAAFAPVVTKKLKTSDMSIGTAASDYIFDEEVCNSSVENCSVCVKDECVRCKTGFYLEDSSCKPCSDNCTLCDNQKGCTKCDEGYYLDNKTCKACTTGCKTCLSASICETCDDGYFKNATNSSCKKCANHCLKCSSETQCEECSGSYFVANDKTCYKYECEGMLCYLTDNKDKVLSIYRYHLGDGGFTIPSGVNICYFGEPCPHSAGTPLCYMVNMASTKRTYSAFYPKCLAAGRSSYSTCDRTSCNVYAGNVLLKGIGTQGWHLPNQADWCKVAMISKEYYFGSKILAQDPFCNDRSENEGPLCAATHAWSALYYGPGDGSYHALFDLRSYKGTGHDPFGFGSSQVYTNRSYCEAEPYYYEYSPASTAFSIIPFK